MDKVRCKKIGIKILSIITIVSLIFTNILPITIGAATPSVQTTNEFRNKVAYNWRYIARGDYGNNCLSYALGDVSPAQRWYWPWGDRNPSRGEAKSLLYSYGYKNQADAGENVTFPGSREIYAYYLNGAITHFAVAIGSPSNTRGHCEIFGHNNQNPYTNYLYGHMTFKANYS